MVNAFVPYNLDLERLLATHPPGFKYHIDCFRHIISLIHEIPSRNKELLKYPYIPVHSDGIQKRVHDYKKYINYLRSHGIFETDNQFIIGLKSIGYRFAPQYQTTVKIEQITKYTLCKSLRKGRESDSKRVERKYPYLRKWFNEDLQIDYTAALDYLSDQLKLNTDRHVENALLKFNAGCMNAHRLRQHDFFYKVDKNVHRLHSNLTVTKSELRNFITYGGHPLVSVDIRNSQPCLSVALLRENFYFSPSGGVIFSPFLNISNISVNKSAFKPLHQSSTVHGIHSYIMSVENGETLDSKGFQPYITAVQDGVLYEYIQEEMEAKTGIPITDRRVLKEIIFTVLFTDNRFIGQPEAEPKRIFRDIFPEVYHLLALIKRKDSTLLPRLLQTIESKLMLDHVARRIARERPEMPLYTIHDSIVCPVGNEDYVAQVIREEMNKAIGVTPTLKYEYWTPDNLKKKSSR